MHWIWTWTHKLKCLLFFRKSKCSTLFSNLIVQRICHAGATTCSCRRYAYIFFLTSSRFEFFHPKVLLCAATTGTVAARLKTGEQARWLRLCSCWIRVCVWACESRAESLRCIHDTSALKKLNLLNIKKYYFKMGRPSFLNSSL